MVNLNRQRIVVYLYFFIVFALIFGLSFTVKGDKITGNFVFEIINNFAGNINLFFLVLVLSGFLFSLAFSLFIIRHAQEIKREIHPKNAKLITGVVIVLLAASFLGFGVYVGEHGEKITGYAVDSTEKDEQTEQSPLATTTPPATETSTQTRQPTTKKITNTETYQAASILLKLTLGKFADVGVSDYCKAQYDGSDYGTTSYSINNQQLLTGQANFQSTNNCIGNETTATAQSQKSIIVAGFTYQTSWTITPCKENVQYTIYLGNSVDDRIGIAIGIANKGTTQSESKRFSYTKNYQFICIQASDTSIGNNGYACFSVV
ncbi:hypothetical protein HYU50_01885 [Candidatus Woesearchaeota archaeon]|nr:hypothetical protein [Candidatus Woesearchaeota archaeon]